MTGIPRAENDNPGFALFTCKTGMRIKSSEGRRELSENIGIHSTQLAAWAVVGPANLGVQEGRTEIYELFLPFSMNTNHEFSFSKITQTIYKMSRFCPDRCGSLAWASFHKAKVTSSIPGSGTCLGCGFSPQLETRLHTRSNPLMFLSHINVSLPFSPPFPH